jgi:hypothetical protein
MHAQVFHFVFFLRPTPNLEDQVSVFMSPSDRVAQLYPLPLDSLFVVFYDSQDYGGGILNHQGTIHYTYNNYPQNNPCVPTTAKF